jgi:hypothetical protein
MIASGPTLARAYRLLGEAYLKNRQGTDGLAALDKAMLFSQNLRNIRKRKRIFRNTSKTMGLNRDLPASGVETPEHM